MLMLLPIWSFWVQTHLYSSHTEGRFWETLEKLLWLEAPCASWIARHSGRQTLQQQWSVQLLTLCWPWLPCLHQERGSPEPRGCSHHFTLLPGSKAATAPLNCFLKNLNIVSITNTLPKKKKSYPDNTCNHFSLKET